SLQIWVPDVQVFPQETQLNGSEVVSLHVGTPPPAGMQVLRPGRQTQLALMHAWLAAHWMPHPPQFWGSLFLSTHRLPAQIAAGGRHCCTHRPWCHSPVEQRFPHPPQLFGSASVLEQTPAQTDLQADGPQLEAMAATASAAADATARASRFMRPGGYSPPAPRS